MLANFLGVLPILTPPLCALAFMKTLQIDRALETWGYIKITY
jgi:hypothetical protein